MTPAFLDELAWRGLLAQNTDGAAQALGTGSTSGYCGFDASGPSLHIGHLVPVMGLMHLQRSGHRPIALVGGGTGMIGDPSGKSAERNLLTLDQVAENSAGLQSQLERFLDFSGPCAARLRNNADWLLSLKLVDFLRDLTESFASMVFTLKCLPVSRRKSIKDTPPSQSKLLTMTAPPAPGEKSRNRSS